MGEVPLYKRIQITGVTRIYRHASFSNANNPSLALIRALNQPDGPSPCEEVAHGYLAYKKTHHPRTLQ